MAPGLLLGWESNLEAGITIRGGQGGELQRPQDGTFNMLRGGGDGGEQRRVAVAHCAAAEGRRREGA